MLEGKEYEEWKDEKLRELNSEKIDVMKEHISQIIENKDNLIKMKKISGLIANGEKQAKILEDKYTKITAEIIELINKC